MEIFTTATGQRIRHHPISQCDGHPCCLHNPSDHYLSNAPMMWSTSLKIMYRICEHGYYHPDRDDIGYLARHLGRRSPEVTRYEMHQCDGCCWRSGVAPAPSGQR